MAVTSYPLTPPAGRLFWLGWYLDSYAQRLDGLADSISSVFIIGTYLSVPFRSLAYYLSRSADYAREADDFLQKSYYWVKALYDGGKFLDILFWASAHFYSIRVNATSWVISRLIAQAWYLSYLVYNPKYFVERFFTDISGHARNLLYNFWSLLYNTLINKRSWFLWLLDNPLQFVRNYIRQLTWWLPTFIDNPSQFLKLFIKEINPWFGQFLDNPSFFIFQKLLTIGFDVRDLLTNPELYIKRKIAKSLGLPDGFWGNPFYFLIRELLAKLNQLLTTFEDDIKQLAIKVILMFM